MSGCPILAANGPDGESESAPTLRLMPYVVLPTIVEIGK
jgi:hypothetical protein